MIGKTGKSVTNRFSLARSAYRRMREKRGTGIFTHKERIYYLCAQGWKNAFDKEPEKYLSGEKLGRKGKRI